MSCDECTEQYTAGYEDGVQQMKEQAKEAIKYRLFTPDGKDLTLGLSEKLLEDMGIGD